jgi:ArsR family transcriptional regulator
MERRPNSSPDDRVDRAEEIALLRAVADPQRAALLAILARAETPLSVRDLTQLLGIAQSTVSHHLRILRKADAVRFVRRGSFAHYGVVGNVRERARRAIDSLLS